MGHLELLSPNLWLFEQSALLNAQIENHAPQYALVPMLVHSGFSQRAGSGLGVRFPAAGPTFSRAGNPFFGSRPPRKA